MTGPRFSRSLQRQYAETSPFFFERVERCGHLFQFYTLAERVVRLRKARPPRLSLGSVDSSGGSHNAIAQYADTFDFNLDNIPGLHRFRDAGSACVYDITGE